MVKILGGGADLRLLQYWTEICVDNVVVKQHAHLPSQQVLAITASILLAVYINSLC